MIDALLPCGIHDTNIVFGLLMGGAPLHNMFARVYRRLSARLGSQPVMNVLNTALPDTQICDQGPRGPGYSPAPVVLEIRLNPGLVTHVLRVQVACL
jgi:hypothetical protein